MDNTFSIWNGERFLQTGITLEEAARIVSKDEHLVLSIDYCGRLVFTPSDDECEPGNIVRAVQRRIDAQ